MRAMVLRSCNGFDRPDDPLELVERARPTPGRAEILIRVLACGVCHTELDEIEGRTPPSKFPVVPGHEIVGRVEAMGSECHRYETGQRVGVGWIFSSSGGADENISDAFLATGRDADGGYAEFMVVPERYACPIPDIFADAEAAPLLCAGAVGFRSLRLANLSDGAGAWSDRFWRFRPPCAAVGPLHVPGRPGICICAQRGGTRVCARAGRRLERRYQRCTA